MSTRTESFYPSCDGVTSIHAVQWLPERQPVRGMVQIAHGVAEYALRYDAFAQMLCDHGFAVVANDHRSHGQSLIPNAPRIYFGEQNGWWDTVDDVETLRKTTAAAFPGVPYILFGHSMGSFLSRTHLIRYPGTVSACILCGTGNPSGFIIQAGKWITDREIRRLGRRAFSPIVDQLAFGNYNKKFKPNRTDCDWLSASEDNVDAYIADPLCGGETTNGLFRDMLDGLSYITNRKNLQSMDKDLPILLISGEADPVGDMGKGVRKAYQNFKKAGVRDVELKLYPGLRHEILNERERETIYQDILNFLDRKLNQA